MYIEWVTCAECKNRTDKAAAIDVGYRVGDTEECVERWLCLSCSYEMYDEAMSHVDY